jgi:predicted RNA methylase
MPNDERVLKTVGEVGEYFRQLASYDPIRERLIRAASTRPSDDILRGHAILMDDALDRAQQSRAQAQAAAEAEYQRRMYESAEYAEGPFGVPAAPPPAPRAPRTERAVMLPAEVEKTLRERGYADEQIARLQGKYPRFYRAAEQATDLLKSGGMMPARAAEIARSVDPEDRPIVLDMLRRQARKNPVNLEKGLGERVATAMQQGFTEIPQNISEIFGQGIRGLPDDEQLFALNLLGVAAGEDPLTPPPDQGTPTLSRWTTQAAEMAPQMGVGIAATVASPPAGVGFWMTQIFPDRYRQYRAKGVDRQTASVAALASSAAEAVVEQLQVIPGVRGAGSLSEPFQKWVTSKLPKVRSALAEFLLGQATSGAMEVSEEGIQEAIATAGEAIATRISDTNDPTDMVEMFPRAWQAAVESAGPIAVLQVPGAMYSGAREFQAARGKAGFVRAVEDQAKETLQSEGGEWMLLVGMQENEERRTAVEALISKVKPTRKDFDDAGIPGRWSEEERESFVDRLRSAYAQSVSEAAGRSPQASDFTGVPTRPLSQAPTDVAMDRGRQAVQDFMRRATEGDQPIPALDVESPTVETPTVETPPKIEAEGERSPDAQLARRVRDRILNGTFDEATFWTDADAAYGGRREEGKYGPSDAYDAMEAGVNLSLANSEWANPGAVQTPKARESLNRLTAFVESLPRQKARSGEKDQYQQFSTPPHYAFVAAWAGNVNPADVVLEPSAGVGGLAIFARNAGAQKVTVNELSERRRGLLRWMGFGEVTENDAEHIHLLHQGDRPSLILMNPPFSTSGERMKGVKVGGMDLRHVDSALKLLQDGGRLVAIIGAPLREDQGDTKRFRDWLREAQKQYNVRARVLVPRDVYKSYGTTFPTQVLVIDKTAPGGAMVNARASSLIDLMNKLREVRNDRPSPIPDTSRTDEQPRSEPSRRRDSGERGPDRDPRVDQPDHPRDRSDRKKPESSPREPGPDVRRPPDSDVDGGPARDDGNADDGSERRPPSEDRPDQRDDDAGESRVPDDRPPDDKPTRERREPVTEPTEERVTNDFVAYSPKKYRNPKAKPHPGSFAESEVMATIDPPDVTYEPNIPDDLVESGLISLPQLEQVAYAGQAHEQYMPGANAAGQKVRMGYMCGFGTGTGKTHVAIGVLLDNFRRGRRRAVLLTPNESLVGDMKKLWERVGLDPKLVHTLKGTAVGDSLAFGDGVLLVTYGAIARELRDRAESPRIEQIRQWMGDKFDGPLIFDEAHSMGNALPKQVSGKDPSATALMGLRLQRTNPEARVLYLTATAATELDNYAYADRLGLWGEGTAFPNRNKFFDEVSAGGLAALESVAQMLKAMGRYASVSLSWNDGTKKGTVTVDRLKHKLSDKQREQWQKMSDAWQIVFRDIGAAMGETGADQNGRVRGFIRSQFYSSQQRFFNSVLTSFMAPTLIESIKKDLANEKSVLLQLTQTGDALTRQALARQGKDDIDDFIASPIETLMAFVRNSFPVQQFVEETDDDGNTRMVPLYREVTPPGGGPPIREPVLNPEMVAKREKLLDDLATLAADIPPSMIDVILEHFGEENVAEVTSRKERVVTKLQADGSRKRVVEKWGPRRAQADVEAFMDGKKRILIFSEAGGTGKSYHADLNRKNQQQRRHYLVQAGWKAAAAIQGLGRGHRSNQASAPELILMETDVPGHKRFISTIARRLAQLGALTRGQQDAAGQNVFSRQDNLESSEARAALRGFASDVFLEKFEDVTPGMFHDQMDLPSADDMEMSTFLNRLLALPVDQQDAVYGRLAGYIEAYVERAKAAGQYDEGAQKYNAKSAVVDARQPVKTISGSSTTVDYVRIKAQHEIRYLNFDKAMSRATIGFYQSPKGTLYAVHESQYDLAAEEEPVYRMYNIAGNMTTFKQRAVRAPNSKWKKLTGTEAKKLWDAAIADAPTIREATLHGLTGPYLLMWDKIPGYPRVHRITLDGGETITMREIPRKTVPRVLPGLGVEGYEQEQLAPKELLEGLREKEIRVVTLANGWTLKLSGVGGLARVMIGGISDLTSWRPSLERNGAIFERADGFRLMAFVPEGDVGQRLVEHILSDNKIVEIEYTRSDQHGLEDPYGALVRTPDDAPPQIRPSVLPVKDGTPLRRPNDIIADLGAVTGLTVDTVKPMNPKFAGEFWPGTLSLRIKYNGNLSIVAHEIGHALDSIYNLVGEWAEDRKTSPFDEELSQLWWHGSSAQSGPRAKLAYKRAEGVAEWIRAWLINPEEADAAAPTFAAHFTATIPRDVRALLRELGDDIRRWYGSSAVQKTQLHVRGVGVDDAKSRIKRAMKQDGFRFELGLLDRFSTDFLDSLSPIWKAIDMATAYHGVEHLLPTRDPKKLIRTYLGNPEKIARILDEGMIGADRKPIGGMGGVTWLFEPLNHNDEATLTREMENVVALMISERVLEQARKLEDAQERIHEAAKELVELREKLAEIQAELVREGENPDNVQIAGSIVDRIRELRREIEKQKKRIHFKGRIKFLDQYVARRKATLSGVGKGLTHDVDEASQTVRRMRGDAESYARYSEAARRYRQWSDSLLQYWVDKGRLAEEEAEAIRDENQFYVSFARIIEQRAGFGPEISRTPKGGRSKQLASPVASLKPFIGSTREIENPYVSLLEMTATMVQEADRNEAMRAFVDLLIGTRTMYDTEKEPTHLAGIGKIIREPQPGVDAITIWRRGEKELWNFHPEVAKAMHELSGISLGWWMTKVFGVLPQATRWAITHSPDFMLRNIIRDAVSRSILSNTGSKPWDIFAGIDEEVFRDYELAGGGQAGYYGGGRKNHNRRVRDAIRQLSGKAMIATPRQLRDAWDRFSSRSEHLNRIAEYSAAYKHAKEQLGYDDENASLYAAYEARDLLDFALCGRYVRGLNHILIFTNAAIQGLRREVRGAQDNPGRFIARLMIYTLPMTLLEYGLLMAGDDEEEYWDLPDWQRDLGWNFKLAPDFWLWIPKPFSLGMPSSAVSRAIAAARGDKSGYGALDFLVSFAEATLPIENLLYGGVYGTVAQAVLGYDFRFDRYIVPPWEAQRPVEDRRGTKNAASLARVMGNLLGTDPRTMEYLIANLGGGVGRTAMWSDNWKEVVRRFAGIGRRSPAYASPVVQGLLKEANRRGIGWSHRSLEPLRTALRDHYDAPTQVARDAQSQRVRKLAQALREKVDAGLWDDAEMETALNLIYTSGATTEDVLWHARKLQKHNSLNVETIQRLEFARHRRTNTQRATYQRRVRTVINRLKAAGLLKSANDD